MPGSRARRAFRSLAVLPLALLLACFSGSNTQRPSPSAPDFTLQVSPASVQIPAGGSAFVTVTLSRLNGFSSAVTLSGAGFPSGVVASGTLPAGASSIQLPVSIASDMTASTYPGLSLRGQSGSLSHDAILGLTVAPPLAASHLRDDLVQAAGGYQTSGTAENHVVVREALPANTVKDASDSTRARHGFLPTGTPTDH